MKARNLLVAASVALLSWAGLARNGSTGDWSFVQLCDPQLGAGGYEHDVRNLELAVRQINASRPDFVIVCGDLVHKASDRSWDDFNRLRAGFVIPCHCAAGNHDVKNRATPESLRRYRETIGKDYYAFDHRAFTIVVANSQLWKAPLAGESEKHDAWFRETLRDAHARKRPIVVVAHYPLFVKSVEERESYWNLPGKKREELLSLFEECGVIAYLGGHRHRFIENEVRGIRLVNGESISRNFDRRPMGYRWWDVKNDGFMTHRFVVLEGGDEPVQAEEQGPISPKIGGRLRRP